jgi:CTP synthase (UTP-ammonia lyase)
MFVRPEEERFLSEELIRMSTFTAGRDELVDRVRMLRDGGYQQLAVQLVPSHEDAMADWMEVFSRV